jgi:geranylgeranyl reductase family protein
MKYDIIIIGGGPAGSSSALHAAQLGARVLLLEKKPMPRPKLCGGWVSRYALSRLGFAIAPQIVETPFNTMELTDGVSRVELKPEQALGVFVDRGSFDHFLVEQAQRSGAQIRTEKALAIDSQGSKIQVRTTESTHQAGGVIICTGAAGDLVKAVRPLDTVRQSAACIEQRVPVEFAGPLGISEGQARLCFGMVPYGYGWILHHGTYLLVGIGCRRHGSPDLLAAFRSFWETLSLPQELLDPVGHLIPLGGFGRRLGRGRCLLAGDAAGMVDALSGEGIAGAIESGQLAAEALAAGGDSDAAALYRDSCRRSMLPHLRWSLRFAWAFYRSPGWLLRSFKQDPDLIQRYGEVLERRRSYPWFLSRFAGRRLRTSVLHNGR